MATKNGPKVTLSFVTWKIPTPSKLVKQRAITKPNKLCETPSRKSDLLSLASSSLQDIK